MPTGVVQEERAVIAMTVHPFLQVEEVVFSLSYTLHLDVQVTEKKSAVQIDLCRIHH